MTINANAYDLRLNMNQIAKLVMASGVEKTYIIEGPMGSGKSTMIEAFRKQFGDRYNYAVVDCTQWDVGDVQIPDVDKVQGVVRFLPNVLLVGDGTTLPARCRMHCCR
jgi:thymidine kinase